MNQHRPDMSDNKLSFGLRDVLGVMIRRKWVILGIALPIIIMATVGTLQTTEAVSANTQVLIEASSATSPSLSRQVVDFNVVMSSAVQVVQSLPVAERAATALFDSMPSMSVEDPFFAQVVRPGQLKRLLLRGVECQQIGESNILRISYVHTSPRFCLMAVGALTDAYIDFSVESRQNTRAIDYYTEQIIMLQAEIDSLMAIRAGIYNEGGFNAYQSNTTSGVSQIRGMEASYYNRRSQRIALENKIWGIEQAIAVTPDFLPSVSTGTNQALVDSRRRLDEEEGRLTELRTQYTEDSGKVRRQREYVSELRRIFYRERDNYITDLWIGLDEIKGEEMALLEAVEDQKRELAVYPDLERRIASIDLEIETQKNLLESLQIKRGEVRLRAESDQRISNITQLSEPSLQVRVAGGKKMLYLVMAGLLAVLFGGVAALFVENQDHRIFDRRQAEQHLGVPVLGAVSPQDGRRRPRP